MERMDLKHPSDLEVAAAAALEVLDRADGVILIPTETFYGLAGRPDSPAAVERIMRLKGRPSGMPLPVLAADWSQARSLVDIPPRHRSFLEGSWPGPLTAVLPGRPIAASPGGTVAVRVPGHDLLRRLLAVTGPLTGTSANRHGLPPATTAGEALASLTSGVDLVLDGGETPGGSATAVLDLSGETTRFLRPPAPTETGPDSDK